MKELIEEIRKITPLTDLILGTLSGEKGSPVFVNNELEVPRLLNFIETEISRTERELVEKTRNYFDYLIQREKENGFGTLKTERRKKILLALLQTKS